MKWNTMQHFWLILACFVVAYLPRILPLLFFRTRKIPVWFNEWMKYVPVSLFTSLVVKDIFISSDYTFMPLTARVPELIAAALVIGVAYWTRSMIISVLVGLGAVFLLSILI
ncbi:AzlD domain-containing protein [Lentilactobacillus laojiaonis]|uniref:AzlD domain-containing protein n=1 Tax=Lentilactobacillus laojiaonis TaxID=2883998 RepID=UPI001D0AA885|nr:AzlD domain-containing protein [Lentilactobacillus laojiaonis]UDM32025.1 AzlD domain-containing protein [Lentilactobacillus laojiaonis]